MCDFQG
jgi:hypothetical protein